MDEEAIRAGINEATRVNFEQTFRAPDPAYTAIWKKYKAFVDLQRTAGALTPGPKYLTRDNVDKYFADVVAYLGTIQPDTASRHVCALAFFSKSVENTNSEPFNVRGHANSVVQKSLNAQEARYSRHMLSRNGDPHANLPTDVLTEEEHTTIITHAYSSNMLNWSNFVLSWNVCNVAYIRQRSLRELFLSDTRTDKCHGPEDGGRNA
jgi:hypothetical protein